MSSSFFESVSDLPEVVVKTFEHKVYYDDNNRIIDVTYDTVEGNYIIITQEEFDACNSKREDYTVIEGKLVFSPPAKRTWNLKQEELARNPYVTS